MDACRKFSQSRHNESNVIPNVVRTMRPLVKWFYIHVARSDRKCDGGREGANGNKFKLNCYIYMHAINNWSRDGHIRVCCVNRKCVRKVLRGWQLQFTFSIGWLDSTILPSANKHYVYIIRLNDFRISWRKYWHCPIWFLVRRNNVTRFTCACAKNESSRKSVLLCILN